jgi:asparagine synthase (glutamine-hydrolysing)
MSFYLKFPKNRLASLENALVVLRPGEHADKEEQHIIVDLKNDRFVGRWEDKAERITAFVSGSLTNVPKPFRPGTGAAAAQVLVALYLKYSSQCFNHVDGAFCCVILDWRRNAIIFGRDKLGIGRAYFCRDRDTVTVSDSLSDLLDAEGRRFELDLDSIYTFLMIGWIPAPHSMFRGIEKLPPGTILESCDGILREATYYDLLQSAAHTSQRSPEMLKQQVAAHLDRSVERGLALGGRWGSFLSGGVDSSSVVSSLARNSSGFPTYFGGFAPWLNRYLPNPEEPAISQLVAARFGTDHHMLWLDPDAIHTTPEIIGALEEPVSDGGCIVLRAVMENAARHNVDGIMTGIGGDFLFTGERRHVVLNLLRYMRLVPSPIWHLLKWLCGVWPLARNARISQVHFDLTRLLSVRKLSIESMYAGFFLQAEASELRSLLSAETLARLTRDPLQDINAEFQRAANLDSLSQILYVDLKTNIPDDLVREAETLGRHFGLNIYNPFLDAEFVDFAMSVPTADKVSGLTLKVPLKSAMRGRVPDEVLDRKKGGLGSPIRWWVTQSDGFVAGVLSGRNIEKRRLFSATTVEQFRRATASGTRDYSKLLWSLFTLELWLRRFIDRADVENNSNGPIVQAE